MRHRRKAMRTSSAMLSRTHIYVNIYVNKIYIVDTVHTPVHVVDTTDLPLLPRLLIPTALSTQLLEPDQGVVAGLHKGVKRSER